MTLVQLHYTLSETTIENIKCKVLSLKSCYLKQTVSIYASYVNGPTNIYAILSLSHFDTGSSYACV